MGVPLLEILHEDMSNNKSIKLFKGLGGYEVGMESKMYNVEFTPVSTTVKRKVTWFAYKVYKGNDNVYFRKEGMSEFFVRFNFLWLLYQSGLEYTHSWALFYSARVLSVSIHMHAYLFKLSRLYCRNKNDNNYFFRVVIGIFII